MPESFIYHVCPQSDWDAAKETGTYLGSADDRRDGFIHFSTKGQARTSTAIHRAGQDGLVLLEVAAETLGGALKWERSRDGHLFPHLYGAVQADAVVRAIPIPLDRDGNHRFPDGFPASEVAGS